MPSKYRLLRPWPRDLRERRDYVDPIFSTIATRYDLMTRILSLGCEQGWKRKAIRSIESEPSGQTVLDLATGTGDFIRLLGEAGFKGPIFALDRNAEMMGLARRKAFDMQSVYFLRGDLMRVPLRNASLDIITMGYGLRYVGDISKTLQEIYRLLRPGGTFVCLDFGHPKHEFLRRLSRRYLLFIGTLYGFLLHGRGNTYWHIVESLDAYPGQATVRALMQETGFTGIRLVERMGGLLAIHLGVRP